MTKTVEVLDALMGSGKTSAIIKYMSQHQDSPWLYISPMLEETETRVPQSASEYGMDMFVPYQDSLHTKSETCLSAMKQGLNICCTHNLMYKFTVEHIELIRKFGYRVVSDEELNLISGYSIKKSDIDFLLTNNIIEIDDRTGAVKFLDREMAIDAKYGDVKAKSDLGMLYAAKRSSAMMVIQLSPIIIDAAEQFILLTYNYAGSIMQTFLEFHGYKYKNFDKVSLWKTNEEICKELRERINFIETKSVQKIRENYTLSKNWWVNATKEQRNEVSKAIRSCLKPSGSSREKMFYTIPKDYASTSTGFNLKFIGAYPLRDSISNIREETRTFIACNARATNIYQDKDLAVHAYNLYPNASVKAFIQGQGFYCNDEAYALNMLLQWLFRGCIRKKSNDKMSVAILSNRMNVLFKEWLMKSTTHGV